MEKRKAATPPTIMPAPSRSPRRRLRASSVRAVSSRSSAVGSTTVQLRYQAGTSEVRMTATPIMRTVSPMSSLTRTSGADQAVTATQRRSTKATEA